MSIKIHGAPFSTATLRVMATANEKELEFEFVPVDMASGGHKDPAYLALHPFGLVPAFEAGDLKLFESRAITNYIATTYENQGTPLLYKDAVQMAILGVWSEVEAHQFEPLAAKLTWELVIKKFFNLDADEAAVQENKAKLAKVLDVYEARLGQSKYMAGDTFTLVDLHHSPALHYLAGTQVNKLFEERPNVCAWRKNVVTRPAWVKAVNMQQH